MLGDCSAMGTTVHIRWSQKGDGLKCALLSQTKMKVLHASKTRLYTSPEAA